LESLKSTDSGRFLVVTSSQSRCLIDFNKAIMLCSPALDMAVDRAQPLDGLKDELVVLKECTVGRPMMLISNLRVAGILSTTRPTTNVQSIEPVAKGTDELRARLGRLPGNM
jgi:hypothetical protein